MAIRFLISERTEHRNIPSVAISAQLKRLVLNSECRALLGGKTDSEPEYATILVDDDLKGIFWVKPCLKDEPGSKKLDSPSTGTRSLHVGILLKEFNWPLNETARFAASWDDEIKALRVDTNMRIDSKK